MANFSETKVTGKKYRVLTDASNNKWKRISFWTAASDVELADGSTLQNFINNISSKITGILSGTDSTSTTTAPTSKLLHDQIASLKSSFQAGVDGIYNAIVAQGTTPASKSQGDVQSAIKTLADAKYAAGHKGSAVASDVLAGRTFSNDSSVGISGSRVDLGSEPEMKGGTLYNGDVYLYPVSGGDGRDYGIRRGVHASPSNIAAWSGGTLFTKSQYDSNYSSGYNSGVRDADNRANSSSTNYKSGYNAGYSSGKSVAHTANLWVMVGYGGDAVGCEVKINGTTVLHYTTGVGHDGENIKNTNFEPHSTTISI